MKKNKAKRKAIHAELRKESKTFEGWLKYEITIANPDGSTESVPAYGKDLQDALSRVVHDEKVQKITPTINKIPVPVWVILWFVGIGLFTIEIMSHSQALGEWVGFIVIGAVGILTTLTLAVSNWFSLKNTDRPY
jgi:hypothetical protein